MPEYKNIPVDQETYEMLVVLCEANDRKQGAQVKALVKPEYEKVISSKAEKPVKESKTTVKS